MFSRAKDSDATLIFLCISKNFNDTFGILGDVPIDLSLNQVDDPEGDIADSVNYPNIRFMRSSQVSNEVLYPDAVLDQTWSVPDGGTFLNGSTM